MLRIMYWYCVLHWHSFLVKLLIFHCFGNSSTNMINFLVILISTLISFLRYAMFGFSWLLININFLQSVASSCLFLYRHFFFACLVFLLACLPFFLLNQPFLLAHFLPSFQYINILTTYVFLPSIFSLPLFFPSFLPTCLPPFFLFYPPVCLPTFFLPSILPSFLPIYLLYLPPLRTNNLHTYVLYLPSTYLPIYLHGIHTSLHVSAHLFSYISVSLSSCGSVTNAWSFIYLFTFPPSYVFTYLC